MAIVQATTIHPNPGVKWEQVQKQLKKACDLARKHGAENVTVLVTMIGGPATNTIGVLSTAEDWTRYGQVQQAVMDDPETQALLIEAGQIATWETLAQAIRSERTCLRPGHRPRPSSSRHSATEAHRLDRDESTWEGTRSHES